MWTFANKSTLLYSSFKWIMRAYWQLWVSHSFQSFSPTAIEANTNRPTEKATKYHQLTRSFVEPIKNPLCLPKRIARAGITDRFSSVRVQDCGRLFTVRLWIFKSCSCCLYWRCRVYLQPNSLANCWHRCCCFSFHFFCCNSSQLQHLLSCLTTKPQI